MGVKDANTKIAKALAIFVLASFTPIQPKFLQVTKFKKYKTWDPKVLLYKVIVLSCPLKNNCNIEPYFGDPSICTAYLLFFICIDPSVF